MHKLWAIIDQGRHYRLNLTLLRPIAMHSTFSSTIIATCTQLRLVILVVFFMSGIILAIALNAGLRLIPVCKYKGGGSITFFYRNVIVVLVIILTIAYQTYSEGPCTAIL